MLPQSLPRERNEIAHEQDNRSNHHSGRTVGRLCNPDPRPESDANSGCRCACSDRNAAHRGPNRRANRPPPTPRRDHVGRSGATRTGRISSACTVERRVAPYRIGGRPNRPRCPASRSEQWHVHPALSRPEQSSVLLDPFPVRRQATDHSLLLPLVSCNLFSASNSSDGVSASTAPPTRCRSCSSQVMSLTLKRRLTAT